MLLLRRPEKQKIVATILARDEEDIIAATIEHHIEQGVSQFIVTDNRSQDKTREIAARYKEVVEIIDEPDETHNQSASVTNMAQLACKLKPDWIVHLDADEHYAGLWTLGYMEAPIIYSTKSYIHPPGRNLKYYLDLDGVEEIEGQGADTKVIHRPDPEIQILHGNHGILGCDKPCLTADIHRHHYPIRSLEQFERKTVQGYEAMQKRGTSCDRWAKWYALGQDGRETLYNKIVRSWEAMIDTPNQLENLSTLLDFWCEPTLAAEILRRASLYLDRRFVRRLT